MLRTRVLGFGLASTLMILSSQALAVPSAMTAFYDVYRNNTSVGYLQCSLELVGSQYKYSKFTKATGLAKLLTKAQVTEKSTGKVSGGQLVPLSYLYDERTRSKTRMEQARFVNGQATGIYKDNAYTVPTPRGVLDRATLELAVARDLKRALPRLVYQVLERGEVKTYTFTRAGSEKLQTAGGEFNTIKVSVKRSDSDRETIYWMAKELDYLPAKMFHKEKGDIIRTDLRKYTQVR